MGGRGHTLVPWWRWDNPGQPVGDRRAILQGGGRGRKKSLNLDCAWLPEQPRPAAADGDVDLMKKWSETSGCRTARSGAEKPLVSGDPGRGEGGRRPPLRGEGHAMNASTKIKIMQGLQTPGGTNRRPRWRLANGGKPRFCGDWCGQQESAPPPTPGRSSNPPTSKVNGHTHKADHCGHAGAAQNTSVRQDGAAGRHCS